jgi:hypothetical protein
VNPCPGFGECLAIDRWLKEKGLTPSGIEFRFWDLDGDADPSVEDVGVRAASALPNAPATDEQLVLPKLIRGAWRSMRDDAGGQLPARVDRLALVEVALRAARLANEGFPPNEIFDAVSLLRDLRKDVEERTRDAERAVPGRKMVHKTVRWGTKDLHVTHLTIASGFETRAAFSAMPGISLLIASDPRVRPTRTAVMAKQGLDLTALLDALYARLAALDPGQWELLPTARPGPSPMILPARRQTDQSRLGGNADVLFSLLQECAAG